MTVELVMGIDKGHLCYQRGEYLESLKIFQDLEKTVPQRDFKNIITILKGQGNALFDLGKLKDAKERYESALKIARDKGNVYEECRILNHLANIARQECEYNLCKEILDKGLNLLENELKKKATPQWLETKAKFLTTRGTYLLVFGDTKKAEEDFIAALYICRNLKDERGISRLTGMIGSLYLDNGNSDKAKPLISESLRLAEKIEDTERILYAKSKLALIFLRENKIKEAKQIFLDIVSSKKSIENPRIYAENYYRLAEIYSLNEEEFPLALDCLDKAEDYAYQHDNRFWVIWILLKKVEIYLQSKLFPYAFSRLENLLENFKVIIKDIDNPLQRQDILQNFQKLPQLFNYSLQCIRDGITVLPEGRLTRFQDLLRQYCKTTQTNPKITPFSKELPQTTKEILGIIARNMEDKRTLALTVKAKDQKIIELEKEKANLQSKLEEIVSKTSYDANQVQGLVQQIKENVYLQQIKIELPKYYDLSKFNDQSKTDLILAHLILDHLQDLKFYKFPLLLFAVILERESRVYFFIPYKSFLDKNRDIQDLKNQGIDMVDDYDITTQIIQKFLFKSQYPTLGTFSDIFERILKTKDKIEPLRINFDQWWPYSIKVFHRPEKMQNLQRIQDFFQKKFSIGQTSQRLEYFRNIFAHGTTLQIEPSIQSITRELIEEIKYDLFAGKNPVMGAIFAFG